MKDCLYYLTFAVLVLMFSGCESDRFDVDVGHLRKPVDIKRLDSALFHSKFDDPGQLNQRLHEEFDGFYAKYLQDVLLIGKPTDPMVDVSLGKFIENPAGYEAQKFIDRAFPDLEREEKDFSRALAYYRHYFPNEVVPEFVAYNSGFNVGVYPTDSVIGIGLEWFLGSENELVKRLPAEGFPGYIREKMDPRYLVPNSLRGYLMVKYKEDLSRENVVQNMLFYGKVYYVLHALTPWLPDSVRMNYSSEQWKWAEENEYQSWKHLIQNDLVYSDDPRDIAELFNDAPFTKGMPQVSPGRMGAWLGLQIVEGYMERYPETRIGELLKDENIDKFLRSYKPAK